MNYKSFIELIKESKPPSSLKGIYLGEIAQEGTHPVEC